MKSLLLPLLAAIALPTAVNANVDPKVAEMCMKAVDFKGCVETMSGEPSNKRIIIDQGVSLTEGNSCPEGYAYVGGGTCQDVKCDFFTVVVHPILRGTGNWGCKGLNSSKYLGSSTTRAFNNPDCPDREPKVGFNSTCHEENYEKEKSKKLKNKGDKKSIKINCDSPVWRDRPQCN